MGAVVPLETTNHMSAENWRYFFNPSKIELEKGTLIIKSLRMTFKKFSLSFPREILQAIIILYRNCVGVENFHLDNEFYKKRSLSLFNSEENRESFKVSTKSFSYTHLCQLGVIVGSS